MQSAGDTQLSREPLGGVIQQPMDPTELLTAMVEASIALMGFSGLVVVLGRRSSGEWFPGDQTRLINLLGIGFVLLACTLGALILASAGLRDATVWALSSVVWLTVSLPYAVWLSRRVVWVPPEPPAPREPAKRWAPYFGGGLAAYVATAGLQVANAAFLAEFWPFLLGLAVLLIFGVTQFIRLLWFGLFPSA